MKRYLILLFAFAILLGFSAFLCGQTTGGQKHVVLLGASVGEAWHIEALPARSKVSGYMFEYVRGGGFDKTSALTGVLSREDGRPHAVFLKECAAYFPGDLERYKKLVRSWILLCKGANVVPIPATVVPVTRLHAFKKILIDIIKGRDAFKDGNPFQNNRNRSILAYNDWIRSYAEENGLTVLDLESAVRYSQENRYLRENFARLDGLHLNSTAYKSLDEIVISTLKKVAWGNTRNN